MALLDESRLQINHRNPVYLDGRLFSIKEQQMDVEWLQQEADNWSMYAHLTPLRLSSDPGNWVPIKSTVSYSNINDPSGFAAHYTLTWMEKQGVPRPKVNLEAVYASSIALGMVPGLFMRQLFIASIAAMWVGIPPWVEEVWSFEWTPGMGDGFARTLPSVERQTQLYVDLLMEHALI
ncbi:MAG: hypothetical protein NOU37_08320 [Candidatus Brocadiales bacterium]|nr:hypothetical protein [Candidatus Bathyanammoxibius amoris]